ncbi:MAG: sugar MFS transporter [Halobacteriaceae archaeon]
MSDDARRGWTAAVFLFVFTGAVGFQMRGALLPALQAEFGVTEALLGLVATAGTAGFIVAVLGAGFLAGRVDVRRALLGSAGATVACVLLMSAAPTYGLFLLALLGRGVATGPFRALDRAVLGHLYPSRRGRVFNLYALVWAVGATLGPLYVTAVLAVGDWRLAYAGVAVGFLPALYLVYRLDLPESVTERAITVADVRATLRRPAVGGMAAALLVSGGIEGTLFTWLPTFAGQFFGPGRANAVLSAFLLAYVPARLLYSRVVDRLPTVDLVLALGVAVVPLAYVTFFVAAGPWLFVSVFCLGFVVSGIYPSLSAFGVDAAPEYSGPVNAVATAAAYSGIAVVPPLLGGYAATAGIGAAMRLLVPLAAAFVLVVGATRVRVAR